MNPGILQRLIDLTERKPDSVAFTFLADGENQERDLSYAALQCESRTVAASLAGHAAQPVLLLLPPGNDYIVALFACFFARAIAVPAYPPLSRRMLPRVQAIVENCRPAVVITTADVLALLDEQPELRSSAARWVELSELKAGGSSEGGVTLPSAEEIAILQYTSGSTSQPKGVVLTHGNVIANQAMISRAFRHDPERTVVSWLPPYHDMGLIGSILQSVYCGARCVHLSPFRFAEKPLRWLQAISKYKAATSGGPNFAYDLCVEKISEADRATLDLSGWSLAFNGAEPIRPETLERFSSAFASTGFSRKAWYLCYGLAEATLIVSGARFNGATYTPDATTGVIASNSEGKTQAVLPLVSSGAVVEGIEAKIFDPESYVPLADGKVGEVWIRGDSVCSGYWRDEVKATHVEVDAGGAYLPTGDLGAMVDGELVVCGRRKEILIVNGKKYAPTDLETIAQRCSRSLRRHSGVAFTVPGSSGEERIVIVQELQARLRVPEAGLNEAIKRAIFEELQLSVDEVVLTRAGTVPRTSSGKLRRVATRELYLTGQLQGLHSEAPVAAAAETSASSAPVSTSTSTPAAAPTSASAAIDPLVASFIELWRKTLGLATVQADTSFFLAGGGSLGAFQLVEEITRAHSLNIEFGQLLENDTPEKLAAFVRNQGTAATRKDTAPTAGSTATDPQATYPLSPAQRRLWVLSQFDGAGAAYALHGAFVLRGPLDSSALARSLDLLVERHEALRTVFPKIEGEPRQKISRSGRFPLEVVDLSTGAAPADEAHRQIEADRKLGFDLRHGPLVRAKLFCVGATEWILALSLHHIIGDGLSMAILSRELGQVYGDVVAGRIPTLTPLARQYRDYAAQQEEQRSSGAWTAHRDFWQAKLAGASPTVALPIDRAYTKAKSYRGAAHRHTLIGAELAGLRELCREHRATLLMGLCSLVNAVLARYSGQNDLALGISVAGREASWRDQIGCFVNTLVLRERIESTDTLADLVERTRDTLLEVLVRQDFPFDGIVEAARSRREDGRNPLFNVLVGADEEWADLNLSGVEVTPVALPIATSEFDLAVQFKDDGESVRVTWEYDTDLFNATTIGRLASHLTNLLLGWIKKPDTGLRALDLLGQGERSALTDRFQGAGHLRSGAELVVPRFEAWVRRTPDRDAVWCEGVYLSYAELNSRANQLARRLMAEGVGLDRPVAILADRSVDLIVALLAVMKSGGCYLPIDPEYPEERVRYLLEDAQCAVVLTQMQYLFELPTTTATVLTLEDPGLYEGDATDLTLRALPGNLAYVIYTSGSTGAPKGVMVSHANLATYTQGIVERFELSSGRRFALASTFAADLGNTALFGAFATGGTLCVVSQAQALDAAEFRQFLEDAKPDFIKITPQHLGALLAGEWRVPFSWIVLGGESLATDMANRLLAANPTLKLFNHYGPAETTVGVLAGEVAMPEAGAPVALGRPLAAARIHILDRDLNLCPIGVAGDVFVGGPGVSRGYFHRPDLTADRFLANPFATGERFYRTGDRGRWLANGTVEFLGREDSQIKIRGYRVETKEVESVLRAHPEIQAAAVIAQRLGATADLALCAYVVTAAELPREALRAHLQLRLPAYMIPSHFVRLAQLPLTRNGKLDTAALPAPDDRNRSIGYVAPRTEAEIRLAAAFAEVLKREEIGIDDDYFDLGGDSIKGIQIVGCLHRAGYRLDLGALFAHPTIRGLAASLVAAEPTAAQPAAGPAPLTPIQRWFVDHPFQRPEHYNQAIVLTREGGFEADPLRRVLQALVDRHDALRFSLSTDHWSGGVREPGTVKVGCDEVNCTSPDWRVELATISNRVQAGFTLDRAPLFHAVLAHTPEGDRLVLIAHHLIVDAVSWRILADELQAGYGQTQTSGSEPLAGRTDQFLAWTQALPAAADSAVTRAELPYWAELCRRPSLSLPGQPGVSPMSAEGRIHGELTLALSQALFGPANRAYHTQPQDLLLSALGLALGEWLGTGWFRLHLEGHGREPICPGLDLSGTVGWFTTHFPFALHTRAGEADLRLQIGGTKEALRRIPRKGVGYGLLRYLTPLSDEARAELNCPFEASFNYLGQLEAEEMPTDETVTGTWISPVNAQTRPLSLIVAFTGATLRFRISFDRNRLSDAEVERLAEAYQHALEKVAAHCLAKTDSERTASDYHDLSLDEADLAECGRLDGVVALRPVTPLQTGIFFYTQRAPLGQTYLRQAVLECRGAVDAERMAQAVARLGERHEALRTHLTYFPTKGLRQAVTLRAVEFRHVSAATDVLGDRATFALEERSRRFALEQGPLFRIGLYSVMGYKAQLVITWHHAILDGWSLQVVLNDLFLLYHQTAHPEAVTLPAPWSSATYDTWLAQRDRRSAGEYWQGYLADFNAAPHRPWRGGAEVAREPATHEFRVDDELKQRLASAGRRLHVTEGTLLQAAWGLVLQTFQATRDVVFATVVSGRPAELTGMDRAVGLFVNAAPVRVRTGRTESVAAVLARLQQDAIERESRSFFALSEIQQLPGVSADLVDSLFVFENYPLQNSAAALLREDEGVEVSLHDLRDGETNYALNLIVYGGEQLRVKLTYDARVISPAFVAEVAAAWISALNRLTEEGSRRWPALSLVDAATVTRLQAFNPPGANIAVDRWVHRRIEEQARLTPGSTALVCDGRTVTYASLDWQANRLAARLRVAGVRRGDRVGLLLERSERTVVSLLAVLKAGAAYLPLDPDQPAERRNFMIADSGCAALIVDPSLADSTSFDGPVLVFGPADEASVGSFVPEVELEGNDLAYVIYTSGSTGRPKGAMIEHRSLVNLVRGLEERIVGVTASRDWALLSNFSFDASVQTIFLCLCNGRTLHVVPRRVILDATALATYFKTHYIEACDGTPGYLAVLAESGFFADDPDLRFLLIGGDVLDGETVRRARGRIVANLYGPTECAVDTTCAVLSGEDADVDLGEPLPNCHCYVLDAELALTPVGAVGQLCIAGVGLGRGYLGRPDLTAERFVANPFDAGSRLYLTGDYARWSPTGALEFLGRMDRQVKIRGHRIELGEIESALASHPEIIAAVVEPRADQVGGEKVLCAYYVARGPLSTEELVAHLQAHVPPYMLPTHYLALERLPLTANGKVDRSQLPAISGSPATSLAAIDEVEARILGIFRKVLENAEVGPEDNFFARGGHSLRAMRAAAQIKQAFQVDYRLDEFFARPSARAAANFVRAARPSEFAALTPCAERSYYPASPAQKRMYTLQQLDGGIAYNIPAAYWLDGDCDRGRLEAAFLRVIARHETLRTRFEIVDGEVVQRIEPQIAWQLDYAEDPSVDVAEIARQHVRPFVLTQAPLFRVRLIRVNARRHLLCIDLHHIISDFVSGEVLITELSAAYRGALPAAPALQYRDYAVWLSTRLAGEEGRLSAAYWKTQFGDGVPEANFPTDFPRPAVRRYRGRRARFQIDPDLARAIDGFCQREHRTAFVVFFAAYNLLFSRYCGTDDVVVGTPVAGRDHPDVQSMLGVFINTMAVRSAPSATKSISRYLAELEHTVLEGVKHQSFPFEEVVNLLELPRTGHSHPLFNTLFALFDNELRPEAMDGLVVTPQELESNIARFDLVLAVQRKTEGLSFFVEYDTDLFRAETIQTLSARLAQVLRAIVTDSEARIGAIEWLSESERDQVRAFGRGPVHAGEGTIHGLFAEQAARTPEAIALVAEGESVTYGELDRRANRFARRLRESGVKPGERVGLMAERSVELIVGMIGILKAGTAYVPIDPEYPSERIEYLLADSGCRVLLTPLRYLPDCSSYAVEVMGLEDGPLAEGEGSPIEDQATALSLAYVMYTSGTTGKPKGVLTPHAGVVRVTWNPGYIETGPEQRVLQLAPTTFDASTLEIWAALLNGGRLVLAPSGVQSVEEIGKLVKTEGVTTMWLSAGLFHVMVEEQLSGLAGVKQLLAGGDVLSRSHVAKALAGLPGCQLINGYGPTENTTFTCCHAIRVVDTENHSIPIGRPVANTRVYILDRQLRPVPAGVTGELYTGGDGLAWGYLNTPDVTAEKFVADPFEAGARMYRTGDYARWRESGEVEFLGRGDDQVKVRGFRVELGEIENALRSHPRVAEAVVVARVVGGQGEKSLCAYYVERDGGLESAALESYLESKLPAQMLPSYWVKLERLPLTANGKVDRKHLPEPEATRRASDYQAPRTDTERQIARIFAQVLGANEVGLNDDFFELGGDSIKAIRVVAQLNKLLGVEVEVRDLFSHARLDRLAELLSAKQSSVHQPIPRVADRPFYPTSSAQARMYALQELEGGTTYNVPSVYVISGPLDWPRALRALQAVQAKHESLRTVFDVIDGEVVQKVLVDTPVALTYRDDADSTPEELLKRFVRPFDLQTGPVFRVEIVKREIDEHLVLLDLHHIVTDLVSVGILAREFAAAYRGEVLAPLAIQYKDFSVWQRTRAQSEAGRRDEAFWKKSLGSDLPVLALPTDYARPPQQSFDGAEVSFTIDAPTSAAFKRLCSERQVSLFTGLLAAYGALLKTLTSQDDLVIGAAAVGRAHSGLEDVIGLFTNTLPLRSQPSGEKRFTTYLDEVKTLVWSALEHQQAPLEQIIEEVGLTRDRSRNPVFDTLFVFTDDATDTLAFEGLRMRRLRAESRVAKVDLTFITRVAADRIECRFEYATRLFHADTIQTLARHFERTLAQLSDDPDRRLDDVDLSSDAACETLLAADLS